MTPTTSPSPTPRARSPAATCATRSANSAYVHAWWASRTKRASPSSPARTRSSSGSVATSVDSTVLIDRALHRPRARASRLERRLVRDSNRWSAAAEDRQRHERLAFAGALLQREADVRAGDLAAPRLPAQLPGQLAQLRHRGGGPRIALRQRAAAGVDGQHTAKRREAAVDEVGTATLRRE